MKNPLATLVFVFVATNVLARSTFELSGTVLDERGLALPGARLVLVHASSGTIRETTTNETGHYSFPALRPGVYSLDASAGGYATSRYAGLRYFADTKPIFNITLRPRAVQESMTFTGEAPLINVSQSQLGLSVEERQLSELPLGRRDYLELVTIEGAAHELDESSPGRGSFGAPLQTVNGASPHYASYELDGFNNTRDEHGVVQTDVHLDAVEELRVISGQFSAEYGRSLAGIVSATTRSGGNDFRGSLFAHVRPGSWDAGDPLTGEDTSVDRQDVGFTFGGPIAFDTTHFFTTLQYRNQEEDVVVTAPYDDGRFRGLFELPSEHVRFLGKLSHQFGSRHRLMATAIISEASGLEGVGGYDIFENRLDTDNEDLALLGSFVSELGTSLNELRVAYATERFRAAAVAPPEGPALLYPTRGNIGNTTRFTGADEDRWQIADTLSFASASHAMKAGASVRRIRSETALERFTDGAFFFAPGVDEEPILYWRSVTAGAAVGRERRESHFQAFFQDDWQVSPYLTLNLGLRWEKETSVPDDDDNFAPRLGLHWDASRDGRTSVRAGYGVFYSFVFSIVDTLERAFGPEGQRLIALAPRDPDFPESLGPPPRDPREPANLYVEAPRYARGSRKAPKTEHVTFGIEREVVPTLSVAVDVSYIEGRDLIVPVDLNAPAFFDYTTGATRSGDAADATRPFGAPGDPIAPAVVEELPDGYPFGGYRDLYLLDSRGSSRYWGVKLNATKRYAADFMIQAVYNWSRAENDGDDFRVTESLPLDPTDLDLEWGRSATDIPHSFVLNGVWNAPYGVRLTGLLRARSGVPVDPRVDVDLDGDRKLRERAFRPGEILERNSFRARAFATLDLSVSKSWELGGPRRLEATLDLFNVTNRLNPKQFLRSYGRNADAPLTSFLSVVQAAPPRQFQVSARFTF